MIRRRPLLACTLALASGAATAGETLRMATQAGMGLMFNLGGDGPQGFCVDHIRALQRAAYGLL